MYFKLMEAGHSMNDIDEMDIYWYFEVMTRDETVTKNKNTKKVYIDQVNW